MEGKRKNPLSLLFLAIHSISSGAGRGIGNYYDGFQSSRRCPG